MSKVVPLRDYVIAKEIKPKEKTEGGFYLPEKAQDKQRTAIVYEVGKDIQEIEVGDNIVYKAFDVVELTIEKVKFLLIKEEDVLAIIE